MSQHELQQGFTYIPALLSVSMDTNNWHQNINNSKNFIKCLVMDPKWAVYYRFVYDKTQIQFHTWLRI